MKQIAPEKGLIHPNGYLGYHELAVSQKQAGGWIKLAGDTNGSHLLAQKGNETVVEIYSSYQGSLSI